MEQSQCIRIQGKEYLVRLAGMKPELNFDAILGSVAPLSDFTAHIRRMQIRVFVFSGLVFAIVLPLVLYMSRRISRSLVRLEKEAIKVGERIRNAFQELELMPAGKVIQKTISLGIAFCSYKGKRNTKNGKSKEVKTDYEEVATQLINLADASLYKAKSKGKNKIELSQRTISLSR